MNRLRILTLFLANVAAAAIAQEAPTYDQKQFERGTSDYVQMLSAVPPDVEAAVKAAPGVQNRDISGTVYFKDRILKATTLRFEDLSTLVLSDPTLPWVAIATKDLVIESPRGKAKITRPASADAETEFAKKLKGADGANGKAGSHATSENQHGHGNPGGSGQDGQSGQRGGTQQLPILYIFAGRIRWGTTPSEPPRPGLLVAYDGVKGGIGGRGGNAGIGGNGFPGHDGVSGGFDCKSGPKDGGDGGFGGRGGRGGGSGPGGDGGTVILAGPDEVIADFILVRQEGAGAGDMGLAGASARGGSGGPGGRPRGHCHGNGRPGINRTGQIPPDNGKGDPAGDGARGLKDYVGFAIERVF